MKFVMRSLLLFLVLIGLVFTVKSSTACEFKFKVESEAKENYSPGDEIIVKVTLVLTHRECPEGLEATKYDFKGIKALGATKWKEISEGTYERKFKLQVTDSEKSKHVFSTTRTCEKDGGAGSISFSVK